METNVTYDKHVSMETNVTYDKHVSMETNDGNLFKYNDRTGNFYLRTNSFFNNYMTTV